MLHAALASLECRTTVAEFLGRNCIDALLGRTEMIKMQISDLLVQLGGGGLLLERPGSV